MLFTTYQFVLLVALLFVLYYLFPKKYQWIILLVGSYAFYAYSGISNLIYFITTTISTYFLGLRIKDNKEKQKEYLKANKKELSRDDKKKYRKIMKSKRWHYLLIALLFNLGILGVIKYTDFMIGNVNGILSLFGGQPLSFMNFALPMGISFYTFQSLGYIIDVYNGTCEAETNLFKYALFVSFFPQVVQGPISRFKDLSETLYQEHDFDYTQIKYGFERILWGFFKKLVIADRMLVGVKAIIGNPTQYDGFYVFVGMMFYAVQLYADFTGGIDVTIGIAQIFGIKLKENFMRPYFSKDIAEFWRRWHITMGSWFRDYIFYPLSVSPKMLDFSMKCRKKFKGNIGKRIPVYVTMAVTWFATGIWHGAAWNFVVWGLLNALIITVSEEFKPLYAKFHERFPNISGKTYYRGFCAIRTFLIICCTRILDCYRDVPLSFHQFGTMFTKWNVGEVINGGLMNLGLSQLDYIILIAGVILMFVVSLKQRKGSVREQLDKKPAIMRFVVIYGLIFAIVLLGAYGTGYDSSQFIYNQF